jgi:hypothetical protein
LYFFMRYEEAREVADEVLKGRLNKEFGKVVEDYREKCQAKIKANG